MWPFCLAWSGCFAGCFCSARVSRKNWKSAPLILLPGPSWVSVWAWCSPLWALLYWGPGRFTGPCAGMIWPLTRVRQFGGGLRLWLPHWALPRPASSVFWGWWARIKAGHVSVFGETTPVRVLAHRLCASTNEHSPAEMAPALA